MKTLSEAVQLQIIEQAGSTYRSIIMSQIKDNKSECVVEAFKITQFFIDMIVKNIEDGEAVETPPILDFLNIKELNNGS